jgi:hydroxymethylpyrimidine pyrophosphatase-like HAD family hydrolase
MIKSYLKITPTLVRRIRLVVADVDGTLLSDGDAVSPEVAKTIGSLERSGIIVGFNSGRPLTRLEPLARELNLSGPIIAENGCIAKLTTDSGLFNLRYSREPGLKTLLKFKTDFPGAIREAPDIKDRLIDVGFYADGVPHQELLKKLNDVQLLDSGYMLHLIPEDVSKGKTLKRILGLIGNGTLRPDEVMVFGDSATDISLFTEFENSVLIVNPRLTKQQTGDIQKFAKYQSELPFGDGFVEVVSYILKQRQPGGAR